MLKCRLPRISYSHLPPSPRPCNMLPIVPSLWMLPRSNQARNSGSVYASSRRQGVQISTMANNTAPTSNHATGEMPHTHIPDLEAGATINSDMNYLSVPPPSYNARPSASAQHTNQQVDIHTVDPWLARARSNPAEHIRRLRLAQRRDRCKRLCKVILYAFLILLSLSLPMFGAAWYLRTARRRGSRHDHDH